MEMSRRNRKVTNSSRTEINEYNGKENIGKSCSKG